MASSPPDRSLVAQRLGEIIRSFRRDAELTQETLAERSGLSLKHVAHVERGERTPSVYALLLLASGLGVASERIMSELAEALDNEPDATRS